MAKLLGFDGDGVVKSPPFTNPPSLPRYTDTNHHVSYPTIQVIDIIKHPLPYYQNGITSNATIVIAIGTHETCCPESSIFTSKGRPSEKSILERNYAK